MVGRAVERDEVALLDLSVLRYFMLTRKASTISSSACSVFESSDGGVTKVVDKRLHCVGVTLLLR